MKPGKWHARIGAVAVLSVLASCNGGEEPLATPPRAADELLARYVALGQSNTAGVQSAGINDSTQRDAYPVLLAAQAGVAFHVPALAMPGCPPPLTGPQPLTNRRVGGANAGLCSGRRSEELPYVSNVAIPGARIVDFVDNRLPDTRFNPLILLLVGGRTQLKAMRDADPTFVSVFPEGNEVLQAASTGLPADATPQPAFEAALDQIVEAIREEKAQALLFGVPDVPRVTPWVQPGSYLFALQVAGRSPKPVAPTCAPGTTGGSSLVSLGVLTDPSVTVIGCAPEDPGVLSPAEVADVSARVSAYNAAIQARARANGWIYLDPNVVLAPLLADADKIRKCQGLRTATLATLAQAVAATCPGPEAPNFWGTHLSFDPIHFNRLAHQALAGAMAAAINRRYGLSIPSR